MGYDFGIGAQKKFNFNKLEIAFTPNVKEKNAEKKTINENKKKEKPNAYVNVIWCFARVTQRHFFCVVIWLGFLCNEIQKFKVHFLIWSLTFLLYYYFGSIMEYVFFPFAAFCQRVSK